MADGFKDGARVVYSAGIVPRLLGRHGTVELTDGNGWVHVLFDGDVSASICARSSLRAIGRRPHSRARPRKAKRKRVIVTLSVSAPAGMTVRELRKELITRVNELSGYFDSVDLGLPSSAESDDGTLRIRASIHRPAKADLIENYDRPAPFEPEEGKILAAVAQKYRGDHNIETLFVVLTRVAFERLQLLGALKELIEASGNMAPVGGEARYETAVERAEAAIAKVRI